MWKFGKKEKIPGSFSYTSERAKVRSAFVALSVQAVIILVVIGIVFGALNYLGIFSVSNLMKGFLGKSPNKTQNAPFPKADPNGIEYAKTPTPIVYDANAKPSVDVGSDVVGYKLVLQNQDMLLTLLNSWGVYDKNYLTKYGALGSTLGYPLKKITVHLTDQPQRTNYFGPDLDHIYSSSITQITPGKFDTYIYVEPKEVLPGLNKNLEPGKVMQSTFLSSIYKIVTYDGDTKKAKETAAKFLASYKTDPLMTTVYFKIEKKK